MPKEKKKINYDLVVAGAFVGAMAFICWRAEHYMKIISSK